MGPQCVALAIGDADHELVPHVAAPRLVGRHGHPAVEVILGEHFHVAGGIRLPRRRPGVEVRQFHPQNGRLERIETAVDADHLVVIPRLHAVHPQQLQLRGEIIAGGGEESAVAGPTEIFRRIETETADVTERA